MQQKNTPLPLFLKASNHLSLLALEPEPYPLTEVVLLSLLPEHDSLSCDRRLRHATGLWNNLMQGWITD